MAQANNRISLTGRPIGPFWTSARKRGDRITQKMLKTPLVANKNRIDGAFKPGQRSNLNRKDLEAVFENHMVELVFRRRIKPDKKIKNRTVGHMKITRRMLATSKWSIISSPKFRRVFNWKKPKSRRGKAWYRKRKLIITWDLMKNDWRMVSTDKYIIQGLFPITTEQEAQKFMTFYRRNIFRRSEGYRNKFSDQG